MILKGISNANFQERRETRLCLAPRTMPTSQVGRVRFITGAQSFNIHYALVLVDAGGKVARPVVSEWGGLDD